MKHYLTFGLGVAAMSIPAKSAEVTQRLGGYSSSRGETRASGAIGGSVERGAFGNSKISSATYALDASVEKISVRDFAYDEYMKQSFPEGSRLQRSASLSTTHTIDKLSDVRLGGAMSSDLVTKSRSGSAGVGHWWFHDTIQTNIDVSRTIVDRPSSYILDYDAETIVLPPKISSGGVTLSVKHLATPTTVWSTSMTRVESSDRPRLDAYSAQLKQYIPKMTASIHTSLTRIINTGPVTTETTSGSLAGFQAEVAFLKSLWSGGSGRVGYRYSREDEQQRAFGDHLITGVDAYTLGLSQDVNKGTITDRPMTATVVGTRYITNQGVAATLGEAGLAVKF